MTPFGSDSGPAIISGRGYEQPYQDDIMGLRGIYGPPLPFAPSGSDSGPGVIPGRGAPAPMRTPGQAPTYQLPRWAMQWQQTDPVSQARVPWQNPYPIAKSAMQWQQPYNPPLYPMSRLPAWYPR